MSGSHAKALAFIGRVLQFVGLLVLASAIYLFHGNREPEASDKPVLESEAQQYTNSLNLSGCQRQGLFTNAFFEKHGDDQVLRFKCGGRKSQ